MSHTEGINKEQAEFHNLIRNMALRDKNALERFYEVYGKLIKVSASSIVRDEFLTEEVINDVLIKVWNSATKDSFIENPRGWIYKITVNCAKDKAKAHKKYAALYEAPVTDKNIENIFSQDSFVTMISPLSEKEKQIVIFRLVENLSFQQIASEIKKPCSTVTSIYYRAIEKIKNKK